MKFIVEVSEDQVNTLLNLLKDVYGVKIEPISNSKATLLNEMTEAIQELNQINKVQLKDNNATDFLNGL